jgi:hypothetical protein
MNHPNMLGYLSVELVQERDKLGLALPIRRSAEDLARPRIEGRKEIKRAGTPIFMLDTYRTIRQGPKRLSKPWPGLQIGVLINTEHPFVLRQRPGIEVTDLAHPGRKGGYPPGDREPPSRRATSCSARV